MESRLTKLAAELVRGQRVPRVLDYAPPDPPRHSEFVERTLNEIEYWGGPRYLGRLAIGVSMLVAGVFAGFGAAGWLLECAGALVVASARAWRAWRDMELWRRARRAMPGHWDSSHGPVQEQRRTAD